MLAPETHGKLLVSRPAFVLTLPSRSILKSATLKSAGKQSAGKDGLKENRKGCCSAGQILLQPAMTKPITA